MAKHKRQHGYRSEVKKRARELFMTPNEASGKHLYTNTQIAKKVKDEFDLPGLSESTVSDWTRQKDARGVSWKDIFEASRNQGMTEAQIDIIEQDPTVVKDPDIVDVFEDVSVLNKKIYKDAYLGYQKAIAYILENDFMYMKDAIEAVKVFKDILFENKDMLKDDSNAEVIKGVVSLLQEINTMRKEDMKNAENTNNE